VGCWKNTRRTLVLLTSLVVYQRTNHRNLWSIALRGRRISLSNPFLIILVDLFAGQNELTVITRRWYDGGDRSPSAGKAGLHSTHFFFCRNAFVFTFIQNKHFIGRLHKVVLTDHDLMYGSCRYLIVVTVH